MRKGLSATSAGTSALGFGLSKSPGVVTAVEDSVSIFSLNILFSHI